MHLIHLFVAASFGLLAGFLTSTLLSAENKDKISPRTLKFIFDDLDRAVDEIKRGVFPKREKRSWNWLKRVFRRHLTIDCIMNNEKGVVESGPYKVAKGDSFSLTNEDERTPFLTLRYEPKGRKLRLMTWSEHAIQKKKGLR